MRTSYTVLALLRCYFCMPFRCKVTVEAQGVTTTTADGAVVVRALENLYRCWRARAVKAGYWLPSVAEDSQQHDLNLRAETFLNTRDRSIGVRSVEFHHRACVAEPMVTVAQQITTLRYAEFADRAARRTPSVAANASTTSGSNCEPTFRIGSCTAANGERISRQRCGVVIA